MKQLKKMAALLFAAVMALTLISCGSSGSSDKTSGSDGAGNTGKTFKVGICNYVDDASLNQIADNIQAQLKALGERNNITFEIAYDNCNADANVLTQIISNFVNDKVDLMVGIATPVAMAMQSATEDNKIPVVFAAVSDPVGVDLVDSLEKPGANITGSSDYLDTTAVMNLIFAADPDADTIGLLYDLGQDASTTAIAQAKEYLDKKGVTYKEYSGTNVSEVQLAAQALIADGVDAVFTPQDNTIMTAELSIYEDLAKAGIPHYTGADSFALNGAFVGYGVDYAELGKQTADMVYDVLGNGSDPASTKVPTFDNGTATVNTEICETLGYNFDDISKAFEPYCLKIRPIKTAESFDDLEK